MEIVVFVQLYFSAVDYNFEKQSSLWIGHFKVYLTAVETKGCCVYWKNTLKT